MMDYSMFLFWISVVSHKSMGNELELPQGQTFQSLSKVYSCWNINMRGNHIFFCRVVCWSRYCHLGLDVIKGHELNHTLRRTSVMITDLNYFKLWMAVVWGMCCTGAVWWWLASGFSDWFYYHRASKFLCHSLSSEMLSKTLLYPDHFVCLTSTFTIILVTILPCLTELL